MTHEEGMRLALAEAHRAAALGEVPVGAVIVQNDLVVGRGHNLRETTGDPTAHAELIAIRDAARRLGSWRLEGTTIFVTIEPCPMCAGALVLSRVEELVFGAADPRAGACGSLWDIVRDPRLNHRLTVYGGVLADECAEVIQRFFRKLRQ